MQNQRISLLEASLEAVKEKLRSFDFFRANTEAKLASLDARGHTRQQREETLRQERDGLRGEHSVSSIDGLLAQSQHLSSSLRRVQGTSVANLRRLQEHVQTSLQEQQGRFLEVEERLLGMLSQKEKVLRNLVLQTQGHSHSIKGIQEWITIDHSRNNSIAVAEESLRERLDMASRTNEMKLAVLQEKINYLESLQESATNSRKQWMQERSQSAEDLQAAKKEMRRRMADVENRLEGQNSRLAVELQRMETALLSKIERSNNRIEELSQQLQTDRRAIQASIAAEVAALKQTIQSIPAPYPINAAAIGNMERQPPAKTTTQQKEEKKLIQYQQREILTSPLSQAQNNHQFPQPRYNDEYPQRRLDFEPLEKKPLPPKKSIFAEPETDYSAYKSERSGREMSGGIRGLLQKSKQKEKETRRESLSREKSSGKRGLPPVREDPFARRKRQEVLRQESEGQQEVVYEIDEEGYLMDQEGNYLLNQHGEMIRLSPEEIQQYMEEGSEY